MSKTAKYIFIVLGVVLIGIILWYFKNIVAYIIISLVLSLIGKPLVDILGRVKIRKIRIPKSIRAFFTLIILWALFFSFFRIFIPLIAQETESISNLDVVELVQNFEDPIKHVETFIDEFKISTTQYVSLDKFITGKLESIFNVSMFSNIFGSIASVLGNIFVAIFSISFITFFFLKDEKMFANAIMLLIPDKYEEPTRHAFQSIRKLLMRYFIGIIAQITGIIILVTLGLTIVGVGFTHSLLIGFIAGILNVIPYLGPIIGAIIGILLGIMTHLHLDFYSELLPLAGYMALVFAAVQITDNILFQPLIYSSSVHAHPLEIFLVILIAGSLGGILGMIVAIPTYTIIRVLAKEFFIKFKVVKTITKNID
ncbi:MAG: AI-2E family transporter [Bacteroidales bacterium]|nr:AI-2E family transporter [Bacteroidales bacterium]